MSNPRPAPPAQNRSLLRRILQRAPRRTLLAEDNPTNRLLVENLLQGRGWAVDAATTGPEAGCLFGQRAYDAVLFDHHLPRFDGLAVAQALHRFSMARRAATPGAVLSADPPGARPRRPGGRTAHRRDAGTGGPGPQIFYFLTKHARILYCWRTT